MGPLVGEKLLTNTFLIIIIDFELIYTIIVLSIFYCKIVTMI